MMDQQNLAEIMADIEQHPGTAPVTRDEMGARFGAMRNATAMSDERLAEIEARVNAASPAPWPLPAERVAPAEGPMSGGGRNYDPRLPLDHEGCDEWPWNTAENMTFAYRAREDVPALLAEIRRLRRENQLMRLAQGDLGAVGQD